MGRKGLFLLFVFLFILTSCGGGGWTKASSDASKCDTGKTVDEWSGKVFSEPDSGDTVVVWKSYNGSGCGEEAGDLAAGVEVEWSQIVENASGDTLVNIRSTASSISGWVSCADLVLKGNMESITGSLSDEYSDLYVSCVNISKQ